MQLDILLIRIEFRSIELINLQYTDVIDLLIYIPDSRNYFPIFWPFIGILSFSKSIWFSNVFENQVFVYDEKFDLSIWLNEWASKKQDDWIQKYFVFQINRIIYYFIIIGPNIIQ